MHKVPQICYYSSGQYPKSSHPIFTCENAKNCPAHYSLFPNGIFDISGSSKFLTQQNYVFTNPSISFQIKKISSCYLLDNVIYAICEDTDYNTYVIKISRGAKITDVYKIPEYGIYQIISNEKYIMLIDCVFGIGKPVIKLNLDLGFDCFASYESLNQIPEFVNLNEISVHSYPQILSGFDENTLICQFDDERSHFKIITETGVLGEISSVKNNFNETVYFGPEAIFRTFKNLALVADGREMMLIDVMKGKIIHTILHKANISNIQATSCYQFNIIDDRETSCCYISNME